MTRLTHPPLPLVALLSAAVLFIDRIDAGFLEGTEGTSTVHYYCHPEGAPTADCSASALALATVRTRLSVKPFASLALPL